MKPSEKHIFKPLCAVLFACACALSFPSCTSTIPVENYAFTVDAPNESAVRRAIMRGGSLRGWKMQEVRPGLIRGELDVRSHRICVEIYYSAVEYTVEYAGSRNMDYDAKSRKIHRKYFAWIRNLDRSIQHELVEAEYDKTSSESFAE